MADAVVAAVAFILALMFLASGLGIWTGLDRLSKMERLRSRWGNAGLRGFQLFLGLLLLAVGVVIATGWRLFPAFDG